MLIERGVCKERVNRGEVPRDPRAKVWIAEIIQDGAKPVLFIHVYGNERTTFLRYIKSPWSDVKAKVWRTPECGSAQETRMVPIPG